jgi:hypothetical protein
MKTRIFSGDYSRDMWDAINKAKTKRELRGALYFVCCRLQELEDLTEKLYKSKGKPNDPK